MTVENSTVVGNGAGSRRGWAGVSEDSAPAPRRQWEGGAAPGIDRHFRSSRRLWQLRIGAFLVLALLLTVGYLVLLLHFPQRTPLVVASVTDYVWPVAPNAWSREDVDGLRRLDGQTVEMLDTSLAWKSRQHILSEWDRSLAKVARQKSETNSAVFYLSLHGLVAEDGAPYLLPPGASPLEREQWVSIEELLSRMKQSLPATLHKLLILDCNRQLDNWSAGLVHNTFAERLAERVAELKLPNLVVLNSTAPGERAWSSADLRGSVFGRAVLLGLAGAADRTTANATAASGAVDRQAPEAQRGGNGDGRVSTTELRRYVAREVKRWSRQQRPTSQTPLLLPVDAADFTITWTLHPNALAKIEQELAATSRAPDSVTVEDINALWTSFDALRELRLERTDPILWHDLEHELLWLEQLATSGVGYAVLARQKQELLRGRLERAVQRAALAQARPTLAAQLSVLGEDRVAWPRTLSLASLTLNEHLGILDATQASAVEAALRTSAASDADPVPDGDDVPRERVERLNEIHFQRLARLYQAATLWSDANLLRDFTDSRLRLESLAARHDPRGHQRLRSALNAADRERRKAEDRLLAGEAAVPGDPGAEDPVAILQAAYEQLAGRADAPASALDRAWAIRDRALAEIPYWARWMAGAWRKADSPATTAAPTVSSDKSPGAPLTMASDPVLERLPKLVVTAHQLNQLLDESPTDGAGALPEVMSLSHQLETELDQLKSEFLDFCAALEKDPLPSAAGRQSIEDALVSPLIPAAQRLALRRTLARFSSELHERAGQTKPEITAEGGTVLARSREVASESEGESSSGTAEGQRLANWRVHPLMTILWSSEELAAMRKETTHLPAAGPRELGAQLEKTSHRLRARLLEISAASRGQITASVADAVSGAKPDSERRVKQTERNTRLAAAVWLRPAQDDAIQTRRRHDLQQLLLWFAERTLDDCYGSGPRNPLVPIPSQPYFDRSVQDYLLAASLIAPPDANAAAETERIRARLTARVRSMKNWATVRVVRDGAAATGDQFTYQARLTAPDLAATESAGSSPTLPEGLATVFLRLVDRRPLGQRATVALPWANRETHVSIAAPAAAANDAGLEAVLLFRGNEIPEAVDDLQPAGIVVDVRPEFPRQAQVTVFGDRRQRSSVVFILDCSGSMGAEIAVEAAGPATLPRLDLAKSSLTSLLEQLAPRGDARVGVRFFGHRVGFSKEKPVKVLRLDGYPDPIPDDLHPSDDVELFLPLGRFDSVEAGRVTQRLRILQPWGQSPLYRALLQARSDFDTESDDTNKSVVVITDGENYQYAGTDPTLRAPQAATVQEVQSAYRGRNIPIYILGFGLSATGDQSAEREFTQLAESTQGRYFAVQNGRDLLKTLRTRLGVGTYALRDQQGRPVANPETTESVTRLNLPSTVSDLGAGSRPYTVRFESASTTLLLEGGEAVALQATPDGRDLVALPYDQGLPVSDVLFLNGRKERFTVRAHRPLRESKHVRFRVSLQDEDLRFTERPAETWVEIKPVLVEEGISPPTYVFYDRAFTSDEPVPVLDCVASNWPVSAKQAEVRVWCKLSATPPAQELSVADVLRNVERFAESQTMSGFEEIQYRATVPETPGTESPWELRVVTQLAGDGPDIAGLRVMWQGDPNAHPQRIVHRYEPSRRQAVHSFWFPANVPPQAVAQAQGRVTFTSRAATRNGAFRAANDRPLIVDVTGSDGTLPLDAATGVR